MEQLFAQLDISDYAETFTKEGIDMDALLLCNDDDLKEGGLPLGMHTTIPTHALIHAKSRRPRRGKSFAFLSFRLLCLYITGFDRASNILKLLQGKRIRIYATFFPAFFFSFFDENIVCTGQGVVFCDI